LAVPDQLTLGCGRGAAGGTQRECEDCADHACCDKGDRGSDAQGSFNISLIHNLFPFVLAFDFSSLRLHSGRSFVFITPYKGKKSGAFQEKRLRRLCHVEL